MSAEQKGVAFGGSTSSTAATTSSCALSALETIIADTFESTDTAQFIVVLGMIRIVVVGIQTHGRSYGCPVATALLSQEFPGRYLGGGIVVVVAASGGSAHCCCHGSCGVILVVLQLVSNLLRYMLLL